MEDVLAGPVCLGKGWESGRISEGRHQGYPKEYIYPQLSHRWEIPLKLQILPCGAVGRTWRVPDCSHG